MKSHQHNKNQNTDTRKKAVSQNSVLNKKSGMLGLSGVSSDLRDVEAAAKDGNMLVATIYL